MAEALRALDAALPITLVSACAADVYDKPLLSVAVARQMDPGKLVKETGADAAQRLRGLLTWQMQQQICVRKRSGGINITPFVDVLLVVLVIFILTSNASIPGIKVDLPKASAAVALEKPKTKAITIDNGGQVFLDAYPVSLAELEERLRTEKALTPDFPVIVRGDASVQYAKVVEVLDLLRRVELNQIGLVTGKPA